MSDNIPMKTFEKCPCCGSEDVNGGEWDAYADYARQECDCLACGAEWFEVYSPKQVEIKKPSRIFRVTVERRVSKKAVFEVKAVDEAHAREVADDVAGNHDFSQHDEGEPEYKMYVR